MNNRAIENFNASMVMNGCTGTLIESVPVNKLASMLTLRIGNITMSELKIPEGVEIICRGTDIKPGNETLTRLYVPDSVCEIEHSSFYLYHALERITGCNGVTIVGFTAFGGCTAIKNIKMKKCKCVEDNSFEGCKLLETVEMPSIEKIGYKAFYGCTKLTKFYGRPISVSETSFEPYIDITGIDFSRCAGRGRGRLYD